MAGKTTEIMMFMALAALREFGKLRGYIMGFFEVLPASSEEALGAYDNMTSPMKVLVDTGALSWADILVGNSRIQELK